ncbi:heat-inducible transcriptional repressor HrcA [Candidatus Margulisiibacteriota bacterium]
MSKKLSERKQKILGAIVEDYLNSAEPVGSRTLSKKHLKDVSPATIRNEMADLEEEGFIVQPHTSAGRIPSDLGYRYYVDALMRPKHLTQKEVEYIRKEYKRMGNDIEEMLKTTARIMSSLSDYATMIIAPRIYRRAIRLVDMVLLDIRRAAVVLLTEPGQADNLVLQLPTENISQNDLVRMSNLLTEKLKGVTITKLNAALVKEITSEMPNYKDVLEDTFHLIKHAMHKSMHEKVMSAGLANIAKQPEFNDMEHMKNILATIESDDIISKIMRENSTNSGTTITIGTEIKYKEINDCSVVLKRYTVSEDSFGIMGVIGPTRMPYNKVQSVVEYVSDALSSVMDEEIF